MVSNEHLGAARNLPTSIVQGRIVYAESIRRAVVEFPIDRENDSGLGSTAKGKARPRFCGRLLKPYTG